MRPPRARELTCASVLLLGSACAKENAPPHPVAPPPAASSAAAAPAGDESVPQQQLAAELVASALREVSRVRGLDVRGPIRSRLVSRDELMRIVEGRLAKELPADVVQANEEVLFALGLVPVDFDYASSLLALMESQLAGFYDPDTDTMTLAGDLDAAELGATLAHELVHALQDQHFELSGKLDYREGEGDEQSALHALAEGDATSAMADQMLKPRGMTALDLDDAALLEGMRVFFEQSDVASDVPAVLKRAMMAPYADGLALVHSARRRGGWEAVNEIWRHPPASTEQVLHPEKLEAREPPEMVPVPAGPSAEWRVAFQDVMGELSVQLVLREWLGFAEACEAAEGWAGDRVAVHRRGTETTVTWQIRYDSVAQAQRGAAGFGAALVALDRGGAGGSAGQGPVDLAQARRALDPRGACRERGQRGPLVVLGKGRDVVVLVGPFVRTPAEIRSRGTCAQAASWARAVVGGP